MALPENFPSLSELISRVIAGDEEAQWTLFNHFEPPIHRYIKHQLEINRCVQPYEDSRDVTNGVLGKSLDPENLKSLHNPDAYSQWIYKIATRDLIAHLRQCTKNVPVDLEALDPSLPSGQIRGSEEIIETSEAVQQILIRARRVGARLSQILDLQLKGYSDQEIGERLGISAAYVRTIRSRGLIRIRSMLRESKQ